MKRFSRQQLADVSKLFKDLEVERKKVANKTSDVKGYKILFSEFFNEFLPFLRFLRDTEINNYC